MVRRNHRNNTPSHRDGHGSRVKIFYSGVGGYRGRTSYTSSDERVSVFVSIPCGLKPMGSRRDCLPLHLTTPGGLYRSYCSHCGSGKAVPIVFSRTAPAQELLSATPTCPCIFSHATLRVAPPSLRWKPLLGARNILSTHRSCGAPAVYLALLYAMHPVLS